MRKNIKKVIFIILNKHKLTFKNHYIILNKNHFLNKKSFFFVQKKIPFLILNKLVQNITSLNPFLPTTIAIPTKHM